MAEILITGVSGFLGSFVCDRLHNGNNVHGISRTAGGAVDYPVDITRGADVMEAVEKVSPDVIVHCAKITKSVDYCEEHKKECFMVNVLGTRNLVDAVSKVNPDAKFIYISTDYVYDGVKGSYTENDPVGPVDYYGYSKLLGEEHVKEIPNHLILRTTVVYGYHKGGNNFFMQLMENQEKKQDTEVPSDQINNPTYVHLLAEVIDRAIGKDLKGTYLATGPEPVSRYDFALKIAEVMGYNPALIMPVSTGELNQKAKRPLNCSTSPEKIQQDLSYRFPRLADSLDHMKKEVEKSRST